MATINKQKISTHDVGAGATKVVTWNNYPDATVVGYTALPIPKPASGQHGTSSGTVEITRVVFTYHRDNYNGDRRSVDVHVKNTGSSETGFDLWESWITG